MHEVIQPKCSAIRNAQFWSVDQPDKRCVIETQIESIFALLFRSMKDVRWVGKGAFASANSLRLIPHQRADLTGDHGIELLKFLVDAVILGQLPSNIGALFDFGGQNVATVKAIRDLFDPGVVSFIVDPNLATPLLTKEEDDIHYLIATAEQVTCYDITQSFERWDKFTSYEELIPELRTERPVLNICNNLLSVLPPKEGWSTLMAIWKRMRIGDYIVISNVTSDNLKRRFDAGKHVDYITPFYIRNTSFFQKSGIDEDFIKILKEKFNPSIELHEGKYKTKLDHLNQEFEIEARRVLFLKKTKDSKD